MPKTKGEKAAAPAPEARAQAARSGKQDKPPPAQPAAKAKSRKG